MQNSTSSTIAWIGFVTYCSTLWHAFLYHLSTALSFIHIIYIRTFTQISQEETGLSKKECILVNIGEVYPLLKEFFATRTIVTKCKYIHDNCSLQNNRYSWTHQILIASTMSCIWGALLQAMLVCLVCVLADCKFCIVICMHSSWCDACLKLFAWYWCLLGMKVVNCKREDWYLSLLYRCSLCIDVVSCCDWCLSCSIFAGPTHICW